MHLKPRAVLVVILLAAAALENRPALAADVTPPPRNTSATHVGFGALVSIQPELPGGSPYLDNALGGVEPGLMMMLQHRTGAVLLAMELSSTRPMQAYQQGRFVGTEPCGRFPGSGCGPALARHRDTLLSALVGLAGPLGRVSIEPKLGISVVLGNPDRGDDELDTNGDVGLTLGADGVLPLGRGVDLALSARFTKVSRGEGALYVGLGNTLTRAGILVRVSLPHP